MLHAGASLDQGCGNGSGQPGSAASAFVDGITTIEITTDAAR